MSLIQSLINEGVCVEAFLPQSGTFLDFSGNGNDVAPTAPTSLNRLGARLNNTGRMDIAADVSLDLGAYDSASVVCYFPDGYVYNTVGVNRFFNTSNGDFFGAQNNRFYLSLNGLSDDTFFAGVENSKIIGFSWDSGNVPDYYSDGIFILSGSIVMTKASVASVSASIGSVIGSYIRQIPSTFGAVLIYNRALTADEHREVYEELRTMTWPHKTWSRDMGRLGIDPDQSGLVAGYDMVPRSDGTIEDKSGDGNHGTINGPAFEFTEIGPSMKFDGVDDYVEIADDPSLDITDDLTLSAWVVQSGSIGTIIGKWDIAGGQRSFALAFSAGRPALFVSSDGTTSELQSAGVGNETNDGLLHHIVAVYKKAANSVDLYIDNKLVDTKIFTVSTNGIFNSTSTLRLGDETSGTTGGFLSGSLTCPKVITRAITPAEIQAEYQAGAKAINWKSDYGVSESVAAEATPGELSNSPARIISGTHKIATDTINGCSAKAVECVTAGVVAIPTAYFFGNDTQAAHGGFEWWMLKGADVNDLSFAFNSNQASHIVDAGYNGYVFEFRSTEQFRLLRYTAGVAAAIQFTPVSFMSINTWYKCKVTISSGGSFTTYLNDTLVDLTGGGGSNPITDTAYTTSKYIVLDLDAGDKVAWASKNGDCAITKHQGVV